MYGYKLGYNIGINKTSSNPPTPSIPTMIVELDGVFIRKRIRDDLFVTEITLTSTGFDGIEFTDWDTIEGIVLTSYL